MGIGNRESGIGNRESGIGNRESGIGNRDAASVHERLHQDKEKNLDLPDAYYKTLAILNLLIIN
uniref:Uncharacterized protein n=1 Tax=Moorena producens (strain JHB) TaxID=1454205 RepID=A0A1D9GAA6_MOOP1